MGKLDVRPLRTVLFCGGDRPDDIDRRCQQLLGELSASS